MSYIEERKHWRVDRHSAPEPCCPGNSTVKTRVALDKLLKLLDVELLDVAFGDPVDASGESVWESSGGLPQVPFRQEVFFWSPSPGLLCLSEFKLPKTSTPATTIAVNNNKLYSTRRDEILAIIWRR